MNSNQAIVALVAALVVPKVERVTGVKLTIDDVAALVGLTVAAAHWGEAAFIRYFPPPQPGVKNG